MATASFSKVVNECLDKVVQESLGVDFCLSGLQRESLVSFILGNDTIGVMPTGHCKTLIFQLAPLVCKELHLLGHTQYTAKPILLVVSPLNFLIEEQVERCSKFGKSAKLCAEEDTLYEELKSGDITYIFASPEIYLSDK